MITFNHYQLCKLKEMSEGTEDNPKYFKTLVVYEDGEAARSGAGTYVREQDEDRSNGMYLALDEVDRDRANALYDTCVERESREYQAIVDQAADQLRIHCVRQQVCSRPHEPTWLLRVPDALKKEKGHGRCLCSDYRMEVIDLELELPLAGA